MTKDEIFNTLKNKMVETLEVEDPSTITLETSFRKDLGADSLDTYELIYASENDFNIQIEDEQATQFNTVGDVVNFIAEEQNK